MFAFPQRHYPAQPSFDGFLTSPYSSPYPPFAQDLGHLVLQQELEDRRRRAEVAAYLEEQERRQRQAALEQAILEQAQRRRQLEEYEQALAHRAALIRRAEEEQEARRQQQHQLALAAAAARRRQAINEAQEREQRCRRAIAAAAAEEEHRRRISQARRQRQFEPSPVGFLDLLFSIPDVEQPAKPTPPPVKEVRPVSAIREPASPPSSATPCIPSFLDLLFRLPPSVVDEEVKPAKPTPSPAKDVVPPTPVVEGPSPAPAPTPVAPEPVEPIALSASTPVPPFDAAAVEEAATVLQRHFRRQSTRRAALATLSTLTSDFQSRQSAFAVPSSFTFQASPSATPAPDSGSSTAPLAFGKPNAAFLGYEDFLVSLLSKIDAVQSGGDRTVKAARKDLVKRVEAELEKLDAMKEHAWEVQSQQAEEARSEKEEVVAVEADGEQDALSTSTELPTTPAPASDPEPASPAFAAVDSLPSPAVVRLSTNAAEPVAPVQVDAAVQPAAEEPAVEQATVEEPSASVAEPAPSSPSPAADLSLSSDDAAPPTTAAPLTYAAVAALPASPTISLSSRPRRASRASTQSVSSQESGQLEAYREVIRRARELGERVRQLEQEEKDEAEKVEVQPAAEAAATGEGIEVEEQVEQKGDAASEAGTQDFEVV
ncbi:hypothetical protein JCM10213_007538 [Rhodosporidiobolus nylandii]